MLQTKLQTGLSGLIFESRKVLKTPCLSEAWSGGRTRARTWDPMIKSPKTGAVIIGLFSQLYQFYHKQNQRLAGVFPTTPAHSGVA